MQLNCREWKAFFLTELFPDIQRGKRLKTESHIPGKTPYVSSSALYNGVDNFVSNTERVRIFSNCLSLANSGSVGSSFYEPFKFVASDHVTHLKNETFNKYHYLFIASITKRLSQKYNFNREINDTRISRDKILLPIDKTGNIDYLFMETYAREQEEKKKKEYIAYAQIYIDGLEYKPVQSLDSKKWSEFYIGDLFEVSRPPARNKDDYKIGNIPFVASGSVNNGVMKLCVPIGDEVLDKGNCITVSPVDGSTFYQPMDFLGRGGAGSSILMLRCDNLNLFRGQFLAHSIKQTCSKYTYGHMGNKDSIKRERIMLPTNEQGKPDYDYMEQYTKNLMLHKYKQYLKFLNNEKIES